MRLSFLAYFVIFLVPSFGLSYLLFRRWASRSLQVGSAYRLTLGAGVIHVGDTIDVEVVVENTTRHVIPLLKLEMMLPEGLAFCDHVGRSAASIWSLRAGCTAVCRYRVEACMAGDYGPDSFQLYAVCSDPLGQGAFSRILPPQQVVGGASDGLLLRVHSSDARAHARANAQAHAQATAESASAHASASPRVKPPDLRVARRLCRTGKLLACAGLTAILIQPLRLIYAWGARAYAPVAALILTPLLMAMGYGIQYILLSRTQRHDHVDEWNFSFESGRLRIPPWRIICASVLAAIPAGAIGIKIGQLTAYLLRNELLPANEELGIPLMAAGCIISAVVGCLLLPFKFQQLLSVRTMVECMAPLVFLFGLQIFWGNGIDGTFALGVAVWLLCLSVCMNRESVLKMYIPVETAEQLPPDAPTLRSLARAGMVTASLLWLLTLLIALPMAALGVIFKAGVILFFIPPLAVFIAYRKAARAKEKREKREKNQY